MKTTKTFEVRSIAYVTWSPHAWITLKVQAANADEAADIATARIKADGFVEDLDEDGNFYWNEESRRARDLDLDNVEIHEIDELHDESEVA